MTALEIALVFFCIWMMICLAVISFWFERAQKLVLFLERQIAEHKLPPGAEWIMRDKRTKRLIGKVIP